MKSSTRRKLTVLALDDDDVNLSILVKTVEEAGYNAKSFTSGEAAWAFLMQHTGAIDIALLDKMMPGVNGMELLGCMKRNKALKHIPVILQTGDVGITQMREGLQNGAYYYLTKPFHPEILTAILKSAENECSLRQEMLAQVGSEHARFLALMQAGEFSIRTISEARLLAASLSQLGTACELTARGLMELLFNAIEHGSLDIGYQKKYECLTGGIWTQELATRLSNPKYQGKTVDVMVEKSGATFHVSITDQGNGFDWRHYLSPGAPLHLNRPNGRGIAIANRLLVDLHYNQSGNEAYCTLGKVQHYALTVPTNVGLSASQG